VKNLADAQAAAIAASGRQIQAQRDSERLKTMPSFSVTAMVMREDDGMESYTGTAGSRCRSIPEFDAVLCAMKSAAGICKPRRAALVREKKAAGVVPYQPRVKQNAANLRVLRDEIIPFTAEHSRSALVAYQQGAAPCRRWSRALCLAQPQRRGNRDGSGVGDRALGRSRCSPGALEAVDLVEIPSLPPPHWPDGEHGPHGRARHESTE